MKKFAHVFAVALLLFFCFSAAALPVWAAPAEAEYLEKTLDYVRDNYLEPLEDQELLRLTLQGIFNNLDPYSHFYTPEEAEVFLEEIEGIYAGVGAVLTSYGDFAVIYEVKAGSPAEKSGLGPNDVITAVDGRSVVGMSLEAVSNLLKGPEGTKVTLAITRNQQKPFSVEVTRSLIEINPVEVSVFGTAGYIKIVEFNDNTEENFLKALAKLDTQHITRLVLDLRNNPGGSADQAVAVARQLIPRGLITRLDFKSENTQDVSFYSDLPRARYKLAVLVNGMSASASEILAGAVQDTKSGILVGSRTYGKSKVQSVVPLLTPVAYTRYARYGLSSVSALDTFDLKGPELVEEDVIGWVKLTVGEYFTPSGRRIDLAGLEPDVPVTGYLPLHGLDVHNIDKLTLTKVLEPGSEHIEIINAEKILKIQGFSVGTPDMSLDTASAAIIKEYQQKKKIRASGALDMQTQTELNKDLERLILEIDQPLAKAIEALK